MEERSKQRGTGIPIVLTHPSDFFSDVVEEAFHERNVSTYPFVRSYIAELLNHYIITDNLFDDTDSSGKKTRGTLAELLLKASNSEPSLKIGKLKKLGDSSLYISGFFSESLERKIVDVDYYVDMGKIAYGTLSSTVGEDTFSKMYKEISCKFVDIVDVLMLISQRAMLSNDDNILRLLDVYSKTGSQLAEEALIEKGILNLPDKKHMNKKQ